MEADRHKASRLRVRRSPLVRSGFGVGVVVWARVETTFPVRVRAVVQSNDAHRAHILVGRIN